MTLETCYEHSPLWLKKMLWRNEYARRIEIVRIGLIWMGVVILVLMAPAT